MIAVQLIAPGADRFFTLLNREDVGQVHLEVVRGHVPKKLSAPDSMEVRAKHITGGY